MYVRPFSELGTGDLALAGGKGANLGELVQAHLPVPPGFVLVTFEPPVPKEIAHDIGAAYDRLGGGAVAVRSSATTEDLPGASFVPLSIRGWER